MLLPRVIPCLLVRDRKLVKGVEFKHHQYVGDPMNAIHIYNAKEVDEIVVLDIGASLRGSGPDIAYVKQIASECFMPLAYGGGISTFDQAKQLFKVGVEKIALNTHAIDNPDLVAKCASEFGSQSILVSIDVIRDASGRYSLYKLCGTRQVKLDPLEFAAQMEKFGAGELMINSIDRDGKGMGYDLQIIELITSCVNIPLVACGGAGNLDHVKAAVRAGASAAAAGSLFIYYGKRRSVLINYPTQAELSSLFLD